MAKTKNLGAAIVREPERAGAKMERKGLDGNDEDQASPTPRAEPFTADKSMRGRWPAKHLVRPTDRENNHAAQTRAK
ncbi:Uncharacterized protein MLTONO_6084 [Mesorhizobium loti]|nr:Uncharacterized protein MLTONO_6084 [Mesorhizobium loti]